MIEFQAVCHSGKSTGLDMRRPGLLSFHFNQLTLGSKTSVTSYLKWSSNTWPTSFLVLFGAFHIVLYVSHLFNPVPRPTLFIQVPKYSRNVPFLFMITPFPGTLFCLFVLCVLQLPQFLVSFLSSGQHGHSTNVIAHCEEPLRLSAFSHQLWLSVPSRISTGSGVFLPSTFSKEQRICTTQNSDLLKKKNKN